MGWVIDIFVGLVWLFIVTFWVGMALTTPRRRVARILAERKEKIDSIPELERELGMHKKIETTVQVLTPEQVKQYRRTQNIPYNTNGANKW